MRSVFGLFFSLFLLALAPSVCAQEITPAPIKVGCLFPLTGPEGLYGRDSVVASQIAIKELEHSSGTAIAPIELIVEDTRSKPLRSLQIVRRFIEEDDVDFICGRVDPSIAGVVADLAAENEVFVLDTGSQDLFSGGDVPKNYFQIGENSAISMRAGAIYVRSYFASQTSSLRLAFIGPDVPESYGVWEAFKNSLMGYGVEFEVVGEYWPKQSETNFSAYVRKLYDDGPDIVLSGHWGLDFVSFLNQVSQIGLLDGTQVMNFSGGGSYDVLVELDESFQGGLVLAARHHLNWPRTDRNRQFVMAFHEQSGRYPSFAAESAYAALLGIGAVARVPRDLVETDRARKILENLRLDLPSDPEGFQSFMDGKSHRLIHMVAIGTMQSGNSYPPASVQLGNWVAYNPLGICCKDPTGDPEHDANAPTVLQD